MSVKDSARPDSAQLLVDAVTKPGVISTAYSTLWNYSVGNQVLALFTCFARAIEPGPINTFGGWLKLGRHVRRGEKAITLCMPVTIGKRKGDDDSDPDVDGEHRSPRTVFVYRAHWFVLSQTDGEPYVPVSVPAWSEEHALCSLKIERVSFDALDGNCQGYASDRKVAVSPIAYLPHRTLFHEIAHVLLHTGDEPEFRDGADTTPRDLREVEAEAVAYIVCQSLGLPGEEFSRGYLQHWLGNKQVSAHSAQRIFHAADLILRAGRPAPSST